ncbi:MAG: hypothetical protein C5B53_10290 [Candidatus Melainabacteria bacterium]|nr:MAG: hypothetical protein C5B53_10290 [Candidatus Melainabacteria bacterium]
MTWLRAGSTVSAYVLLFALAVYSILPAAFAYKAWGKDVFVGVQPRVHGAITKHLSHLNSQMAGAGNARVNGIRDKWALLIGTNLYQDKTIKPMRIARNDVLLISALLREPGSGRFAGDHINYLIGKSATREAVEQAILNSSLIKNALPNDLILLYLSGRTLPLGQERDLCLCTYDTLASEAGISGLKLADALTQLRKRTQCPQIVCVLDCASVSKKDFEQNVVSLEELSRKTGVSIISASDLSEDTPACYGGTISSFALYFANAIKNSSGNCSLAMIVNYVQDNLNRESQELGTASQAVSFIPSESNARARDIVLGTPVRNASRRVAIGHNVKTLALDRPDLTSSYRGVAIANNTVPAQPHGRIINGKTPDEDEEEKNFSKVDYGPWMDKMKRDIRSKWRPPKGLEQRHVAAVLTIKRDGSIVTPSLVESSGNAAVDQSALDALKAASPLDPLPAGAPASVQVRYVFDWKVAGH